MTSNNLFSAHYQQHPILRQWHTRTCTRPIYLVATETVHWQRWLLMLTELYTMVKTVDLLMQIAATTIK